MSELAEKERRAIKILRMYRGDDVVIETELIDALYDMVIKLKKEEGVI